MTTRLCRQCGLEFHKHSNVQQRCETCMAGPVTWVDRTMSDHDGPVEMDIHIAPPKHVPGVERFKTKKPVTR